MSLVISTLLTAGPALIRMFGRSKGGNTEKVAETVADVMDKFTGKSRPEKEKALEEAIKTLPPGELAKLQVELAQVKADQKQAELDYDLGMHQAQQSTIQSGDNAEDKYVRHTRPMIVRGSFYAEIVYLFFFEGLAAFDHGSGASWELATVIAAPVLAYFGFRTWDKVGTSKNLLQGITGKR